MDKETFWASKNPAPEYWAISFDHPSFDAPFRLVANQFEPVTLAGFEHTPAPMSIKPPDQKSGDQPKLSVAFPRQVVGREFKRQLMKISESGSRAPIVVTHSVFLGDTDAPKVTWKLYAAEASGITFNTDTVQVSATDSNPMRLSAAVIYTPQVFTGLELL